MPPATEASKSKAAMERLASKLNAAHGSSASAWQLALGAAGASAGMSWFHSQGHQNVRTYCSLGAHVHHAGSQKTVTGMPSGGMLLAVSDAPPQPDGGSGQPVWFIFPVDELQVRSTPLVRARRPHAHVFPPSAAALCRRQKGSERMWCRRTSAPTHQAWHSSSRCTP
jgi:hypothetical protein